MLHLLLQKRTGVYAALRRVAARIIRPVNDAISFLQQSYFRKKNLTPRLIKKGCVRIISELSV